MAVFLLFIDGVGVGKAGPENPFSTIDFSAFQRVANKDRMLLDETHSNEKERVFRIIDACLHTEGLPQSGTGQASLFSGQNASHVIGRHFGPYPHSAIKHLLEEESLFFKTGKLGYKAHFINAFPDIFFERSAKTGRWSCTTLMTKNAGLSLNTQKEVLDGKAVTAEIKQDYWNKLLHLNVPEISEEEAADRVLNASLNYDLILSEYYLTDKAGHEQNHNMSIEVLNRFDRFASHILKNHQADDSVIITSDHGNIEDLSVKTHTRNPIPLLVSGKGADYFSHVDDLTGITPAIIETLSAT